MKAKSNNASTASPEETPITIDVFGLARLLSISPGTVRNRLSRGAPMPASILIGSRRVWLRSTAIEWLLAREDAAHTPGADSRPTRQVARAPKQATIERRRQMLTALEQRSGAHQGQ
ncbi:MAG: hypothetical protein Q8L99_07985 [Polycyclovorans sp.]|nr:hypothetical protein [Polycyclovorans sp.]